MFKVTYFSPDVNMKLLQKEFDNIDNAKFVFQVAKDQGKVQPEIWQKNENGKGWFLIDWADKISNYTGMDN